MSKDVKKHVLAFMPNYALPKAVEKNLPKYTLTLSQASGDLFASEIELDIDDENPHTRSYAKVCVCSYEEDLSPWEEIMYYLTNSYFEEDHWRVMKFPTYVDVILKEHDVTMYPLPFIFPEFDIKGVLVDPSVAYMVETDLTMLNRLCLSLSLQE